MPRTLAVRAARAAAEKQGRDIRVLEVRHLIAITDYFVIVSGATDRQVKAIGDEVEAELRKADVKPMRREGERLWKDAPHVAWEPAAPKAKATTAR